MTHFATTGHVSLTVSLGSGEVTVDEGSESGVGIDLIPLRDNDATRQAIEEARVEMTGRGDGHEIVVQVQKRSGFMAGRGAKVGVRVRCPRGSDLYLRSGSADLEATGDLGVVDVKTSSGDVSLERAERLRFATASGDLRADEVSGPVECRTASGDVRIRRSGGLLDANLVSGDLSVGVAASGLSITTVSGDVRVDGVGGGSIKAQSVSGDVRLAIAPGERLFVDASSVSGKMRSELDLGDDPAIEGEGPVHELRVRTVSGDLLVLRGYARSRLTRTYSSFASASARSAIAKLCQARSLSRRSAASASVAAGSRSANTLSDARPAASSSRRSGSSRSSARAATARPRRSSGRRGSPPAARRSSERRRAAFTSSGASVT